MVRELEKEGVRWQSPAKRNRPARGLADKKVVAPLLKFLMATEVGKRKGARDREVE